MFESLTSKRSYSKRSSGLWILVSSIYLALAVRLILHKNEFGWFLLPVWAFVFVVWLGRAMAGHSKDKNG